MNPSAQDIADAVQKINASNVFVFPNNSNVILAAQIASMPISFFSASNLALRARFSSSMFSIFILIIRILSTSIWAI